MSNVHQDQGSTNKKRKIRKKPTKRLNKEPLGAYDLPPVVAPIYPRAVSIPIETKRRVSLVLDFDNKGFFIATESPSAQVSSTEDENDAEEEYFAYKNLHGGIYEDEDLDAEAEAEWLAAAQSTAATDDHVATSSISARNGTDDCVETQSDAGALPANAWLLVVMMLMVGCFALVELIVGFASDSLALLADSFHMMSDLLSLIVGFVAMWLAAKRQKTNSKTYGWKRAEVIGALVNGVFLVSVCFYTVTEAAVRLIEGPPELRQPELVLIVGGIGLVINIIGLLMFCSHRSLAHHGHSHGHSHDNEAGDESHKGKTSNVNMHGVFLHVLSDALGSLIVIGAVLIYLLAPDNNDGSVAAWKPYLDPCCSIVFSAFILRSAVPLLKHTVGVLMQSVPANVDLEQLRLDIMCLPGVFSVHDLHVWQLVGAESVVGTVHIVCTADADRHALFRCVKRIFCKYKVHKTTVQCEDRHAKYSRRAESLCDDCCRGKNANGGARDAAVQNASCARRTYATNCESDATKDGDQSPEHSCCQMTSSTEEE